MVTAELVGGSLKLSYCELERMIASAKRLWMLRLRGMRLLESFDWQGRSAKVYRVEIRRIFNL